MSTSRKALAQQMARARFTPARLRRVLSAIGLIAAVFLTSSGCEPIRQAPDAPPSASRTLRDTTANRLQAVVFDARYPPSDQAMRAIHELGTTHLALVSFGFQETHSDTDIRFSPDVGWYSESGDGVRALAQRARALGMEIILKPQMWLRGGAWTADIHFDTDAEWEAWEADYRSYLMHTARLAAEIGADMLVIGTEMATPVRERPDFWRRLIADIRSVYDGRLTYGANWHDDYLHVPFWDALDAIGVQAYFPLSATPNPDLEAIKSGWTAHIDELRALAQREGRPVIFTEVGYRSVPYAAEEPWRWPARDEQVRPDYRLQADLFRAFFESTWDQPWFDGAIIWKMYPEDGRRSRGRELDFTPQGKPAEDVVRAWFRKSVD